MNTIEIDLTTSPDNKIASKTTMEDNEDTTTTSTKIPSCFVCVVCKTESVDTTLEDASEESDVDCDVSTAARVLTCLHHVCSKSCIAKCQTLMVLGTTTIVCPVCSVMVDASQINENNYRKEYPFESGSEGVEKVVPPKPDVYCTFCDLANDASSYCTDCKEFLCTDCAHYHMKMKKTKSHVHVTLEEGLILRETESPSASTTGSADLQCSVHEDEVLSLYCVTCDAELCPQCGEIPIHNEHELKNLGDCFREFRDMLNSIVPDILAYKIQTKEAIVDLNARVTNVLKQERVKLLAKAQTQVHKVQALLLQRELEIREEIVKQTLYKAKELNVKRCTIVSTRQQASQYLELIPKLLEYKDRNLFSKRKWLAKQYFRLRESMEILLDDKQYKDYVEQDWFFHIGDGVLLETMLALKALGGFVYTDGDTTQKGMVPFNAVVVTSTAKPGSLETIFESKYRSKETKERRPSAKHNNEDGTSRLITNGDSDLEALELSVENEYLEFDTLKQQHLSPPKGKGKEDGSHRFGFDKTAVGEEGDDSNSDYDPVLQTAQGIEKRRHTHSESDDEHHRTTKTTATEPSTTQSGTIPPEPRRSGRSNKGEKKPRPDEVLLVKPPSLSPSIPQPVRKSSRFEATPRPKVVASGAAGPGRRRNESTLESTALEKGRQPVQIKSQQRSKITQGSVSGIIAGPVPPRTYANMRKKLKVDGPPRLAPEVSLGEEEHSRSSIDFRDVSFDDTPKKLKSGSGDEWDEFEVEESDTPTPLLKDGRKKPVSTGGTTPSSAKRRRDPFTKPQRRRKPRQKKEGDTPSIPLEVLAHDEQMKITNDDENEDYCTVCLDGGENLICCDNCPKVFHIQCHIPALSEIPNDAWSCLFCQTKDQLDTYVKDKKSTAYRAIIFPSPDEGMSHSDFLYACKFLADIYALKTSLLVRYHLEKLHQKTHGGRACPVHLNHIRGRLTLGYMMPFRSLEELVQEVHEMIREARKLFSLVKGEFIDQFLEFEEDYGKVEQLYFPGGLPKNPANEPIVIDVSADDDEQI